jgi:hypothetical protein
VVRTPAWRARRQVLLHSGISDREDFFMDPATRRTRAAALEAAGMLVAMGRGHELVPRETWPEGAPMTAEARTPTVLPAVAWADAARARHSGWWRSLAGWVRTTTSPRT